MSAECTEVDPLRQFIDELCNQERLASRPIYLTLQKLRIVLNPDRFLPTEAKTASAQLEENAKDKVHLDGGLAAVFVSIQQGKKMVKMCEQHVNANAKDIELFTKLESMIARTDKFVEDNANNYKNNLDSCLDLLLDTLKLIKTFAQKDDVSSPSDFINKVNQGVSRLIGIYCETFVSVASEWFQISEVTFSSSQKFAPLPALHTGKIEEILQYKQVIDSMAIHDLQAMVSLPKEMIASDKLVNQHTPADTVESLQRSKAFSKFQSDYGGCLAAKNASIIASMEKFGLLLSSISCSKVKSDIEVQKEALGRLVFKAGLFILAKGCCNSLTFIVVACFQDYHFFLSVISLIDLIVWGVVIVSVYDDE